MNEYKYIAFMEWLEDNDYFPNLETIEEVVEQYMLEHSPICPGEGVAAGASNPGIRNSDYLPSAGEQCQSVIIDKSRS